MIAARRASLAEQLQNLFRRAGREYWPIRVNLHLAPEIVSSLPQRFANTPSELAGRRVERADRTDGLKLMFTGDSWVLMRPSGTEPLVRIYAEADSLAASKQLAEDAQAWVSR
jgi:phosphomannomutase